MGRTILLTYADAAFRAGQAALCASARRVGFDAAYACGPDDLAGTAFAATHRATLAASRGGGYWLWKPFLLRQRLDTIAGDDVLFYCDASSDGFYRFDRFPERLVARVRASARGFVIGPVLHQHGPLSHWTKRDALVLLDADRADLLARPLIQATWSLWRRTEAAAAFLDTWLAACADPRILTDAPNVCGLPNYPGFIDHRHDQSALSLIAYRDGHEVLDVTPTGIFKIMALRPHATMTHRFLKAPRNVERLLRGQRAGLVYAREAAIDLVARRVLRRRA